VRIEKSRRGGRWWPEPAGKKLLWQKNYENIHRQVLPNGLTVISEENEAYSIGVDRHLDQDGFAR